MNKKNSNKARLAFDLLQKEMQVMSEQEARETIGGDGIGKITGGSGTLNDPYIITANFYYGNEISDYMKNGINTMISNFNNAGNITVDGKYYKFSFGGVIANNTKEAMNSAGIDAATNGLPAVGIKTGNLADSILGKAGSVVITIDETKTMFSGSNISSVITHEAGHIMGYDGKYDSQGHSPYTTGIMAPETYQGQPETLSYEELQNIIINGVLSASTGNTQSENPANPSYGSSGIISTGFENDIYWENYYVYEENGMYGSVNEGPLTNPWSTYSTGYNYSTGSESTGVSTGSESTGTGG